MGIDLVEFMWFTVRAFYYIFLLKERDDTLNTTKELKFSHLTLITLGTVCLL